MASLGDVPRCASYIPAAERCDLRATLLAYGQQNCFSCKHWSPTGGKSVVAYGPHCLPTGSMHMHGGLRAALLAYGQHAYAWHCLPTGSTRVVGCSARLRAAQGLWPKGCIARLRAAEGLQLMVPIACLRQHCLPIAADILAALRAYGQHVMQPAGSSYRMPHGASCLVNVIYIYVYIRHLYIRILKYIFLNIYIYM